MNRAAAPTLPTRFTRAVAARVEAFTRTASQLPGVQDAVQDNHDQNRWWPTTITDPRVRMLAAGWSARVSYRMVDTYARVVRDAAELGFDTLTTLPEDELLDLVRPLGLPDARLAYLHSLAEFLASHDPSHHLTASTKEWIAQFAGSVQQASYKVAQCALLCARGYHCGIIPVDSGMVTKLAPVLGLRLPAGNTAHEHMRNLLEASVNDRPDAFRTMAADADYKITIPSGAPPTWFVHLVLIYTKRLYLNRPGPALCPRRPVCPKITGCAHRSSAPSGQRSAS